MKNSLPIRHLPANTLGKDYVVGDLHGCFQLLEKLLRQVGFNSRHDRLFSVGDMIDRGPEPLRCLNLLKEPWFFAVMGNHEFMMLDFFRDYLHTGRLPDLEDQEGSGFLAYGGSWVSEYFDQTRQGMSDEFNRILPFVLDLPLIWIVGENQSRFHVLHAELVKSEGNSQQPDVWLNTDIDGWLTEHSLPANVQEKVLWGRSLMSAKSNGFVKMDIEQPGLSKTFCGHTFASRTRQVLSHICVDTGAYTYLYANAEMTSSHGLTLFDVQDSRWYLACQGNPEIQEGVFIPA